MTDHAFQIVGSISTVAGSILLSWRVKIILKWVVNVVYAHEISIHGLSQLFNSPSNSAPIITGTTTHLDNTVNGPGFKLLVAGFALIGVGIILQGVGIYLKIA